MANPERETTKTVKKVRALSAANDVENEDEEPLIKPGSFAELVRYNVTGILGDGNDCEYKLSIKDIEKLSIGKLVETIQRKFKFYKPKPVKRVEIPKPNRKTRPLGISTIIDRLVQQCILQALEPICEANFHERSNGFRPNRSAEHALAQCYKMIQQQNLHFIVDVDIKGFFDNVNHSKLIRQMWALGIRDKQLICIIKEMLKAPIIMPNGSTQNPTKGTPQGGILSPLLANIVLNKSDWWISTVTIRSR